MFKSEKNFRNWLDDDCKNLMLRRDKQREIAKISDLSDDWAEYKKLRNVCTKKLRKTKNEYTANIYKNLQKNGDTKTIFSTTKSILGWNSNSQPSCLISEGLIFRKPEDLANTLKNYYDKKIKKLLSKIKKVKNDPLELLKKLFEKWSESENVPIFKIREISVGETLKLISKMGKSSAFGRDELDAISIKSVKDYLALPITHIVNSSITSRVYIMKWKQAKIIPILKSPEHSRMDPASYRPISLLPVLSKIVERAVQMQMQLHFEEHKLLHPNSHAYRKNSSTTTAIMQLVDTLYTATDDNLMTSMLALDQSAAFDCVSHQTLLRKLKIYKCSPETLEWIASYLKG